MAEHDLTARMGCFLDRHLVFPLLEFLSVKEVDNLLYYYFVVSLPSATLTRRNVLKMLLSLVSSPV